MRATLFVSGCSRTVRELMCVMFRLLGCERSANGDKH